MSWLEKLMPSRIDVGSERKKNVPEGLWAKCENCEAVLYRAELERTLEVCPKCNAHRPISARLRLDQFLDPEPREEIGAEVRSADPLKFKDTKKYTQRLVEAQKATGETEALVVMRGAVMELPLVACAFEFRFIGGSMGSAVGERFVRGVNAAIAHSVPFVCFSASGGARMQESLFSLLQMAKTSAALSRLSDCGLPYVSVMTHPTMGGVSASLAMLGDLNVAEPMAQIGFSGPRVIEQTVRQTLPEGFQRSEFLLEHGAIDLIIDRREMRVRLHRILSMLTRSGRAAMAAADGESAQR